MATRHQRRTALATTLATLIAIGGGFGAAASPVQAQRAHNVHMRLDAAIARLQIAREHRAGYDRSKFNLWVDADHDCRDTRDEVLAAESRTAVHGCDIQRGRWFSYYDHKTWTHSSAVDIDHVVPLAESWDSGAWRWSPRTRERYANDLNDSRTLIAVTDNVNEAKGDSDIAEWEPQHGDCRYLRDWVAIKTRWRLRVDSAEKQFMVNAEDSCPNSMVKVTIAQIHQQTGGSHHHRHTGIKIKGVFYNPPGDESQRPNGEWLAITNRGQSAVNLNGWSLSDDTTETYYFGDVRIAVGKTIKIRSGHGHDTASNLYAGWGSRWNNDGDTATLYVASGAPTDRCSYTGSSAEYASC